MCSGAAVWARIENLYIGAMDSKAGACGSVFRIPTEERLNHNIHVETGIMEEECAAIMRQFFSQLRDRRKKNKNKMCIRDRVREVKSAAVLKSLQQLLKE